jgi:uncharacterized membrane protein YkvA (DUF1232 family)
MKRLDAWRQKAKKLVLESRALWFAYRDPRTPWYAKVMAAVVVAYAVSPIDLIPDFIPVLGYLDDLLLLPLGIALAIRMIPREVLADYRRKAQEAQDGKKPSGRIAVVVIAAVWIFLIAVVAAALVRAVRGKGR